MVKNMEQKKVSYLNLLIIFFLSYSFYMLQILTQELFYSYSKQCVLILCLFQLLFPLFIYIVCKIINSKKLNKNTKNNFIFSILSSIYLIVTAIISVVNITNIVILYYYQQTNYIILLIFISLPLIYTILREENTLFSLASILLIIYTVFKYAYLGNNSKIDFYVFHDIINIKNTNILPLIIYSLPILLEPLILLNNEENISDKINIKLAVSFAFFISLIGILTILRQTWEFGALLDKIRFPYLESIKNIIAGDFFENIDFYYLLSIAASIYIRLGYSLITIKKTFNLNKLITISLLVGLFLLVYIIQKSMNLYLFSINKILIISSTCLLICLILLPFIMKRRKKINA